MKELDTDYEVIIIGAGPAGLKAAEILAKEKKVLVLEKNKVIGQKVCAGAISDKDFLYIPRSLVEREFSPVIFSYKKKRVKVKKACYTIDRHKLGSFQLDLATNAGARVMLHSEVKKIDSKYVYVQDKRYSYKILIGADGSNSIVRKYLDLKTTCAIAFQYKIEQKASDLEFHYDTGNFKLLYTWIFPHKEFTYFGTGGMIGQININKVKDSLKQLAKERGYTLKEDDFEAAIINVDYKGIRFGNTYLVGDAAGIANKFSGEGIYQALVSGDEVAKMILDPSFKPIRLNGIVKKITKLNRLYSFLYKTRLYVPIYWFCFQILDNRTVQNKFIETFVEY